MTWQRLRLALAAVCWWCVHADLADGLATWSSGALNLLAGLYVLELVLRATWWRTGSASAAQDASPRARRRPFWDDSLGVGYEPPSRGR